MTMSGTVAVVDYGMGNLRSVSQAVHACRAQGSGVERGRHVATRTRCAPPSAWCCRARARCATACASCATPASKQAVLEAAAAKPLMGVCVGMQMLLDHSEEQDTPGSG